MNCNIGKFFRVAARPDVPAELHGTVVEVVAWLKHVHRYSCRVCATGKKVQIYANDLL